ncbi:MAG: tetratricopeptide repeat protein [Candidatus Omnitrophica bacterium]|nr:tetratricopeptide repeat protein [Candidatus Omnitrophota bacterium]
MDNIDEKIRNIEEWNAERGEIKPIIDIAVEYHNKARAEAHWKNYTQSSDFYKAAIENYKKALNLSPRYYLQDLLDRVDHVIEEHINNVFNLKTEGETLKTEKGIQDFVEFIEQLKHEEKSYLDLYDIARIFLKIGDLYRDEGDFDKAYGFYNRAISVNCGRPFVNRDAYFKSARILFDQKRYKEALVDFLAVLSFDRENNEIIAYIVDCLKFLKILKYKDRFLAATPKEATKLIMEVL